LKKESSIIEQIDRKKMPAHIAIIMDGNGRWAKKKKLPRVFGHRAGMKTVKSIVETCVKLKVKVLTLYAFSTENWVRPKSEVNALMGLLKAYVNLELKNMMENDIKLMTIGDTSGLPENPRKELLKALDKTKNNKGMILNLALNYGSRDEIIRAFNRLLKKDIDEVDEKLLAGNLDTANIPDPDLLIRTSGEMRLSNFMLWQCAYTEFYITPVFWPDFMPENLYKALIEYQNRHRRYGGV
jgi:undecaprenyl diphosphate synthase